jgi:type I restriction enzyme S subunit
MTNSQNWKLETIESIANGGLIADGDWVESKDQDFEGKIRLTQLADVGDGEFRNRSNRWMNEEQVTRLDVTFLKPNDILIARMPDPLGRACLVPANIGRAVTVVDVAILRIARKDILPKYITLLLNSPQIRQQMLLLASGTTRQRISRRNLQSIDLPVPSPGVQEEIVEILEDHLSRLDAALADVKQAKLKAAKFRSRFIQELLSRELLESIGVNKSEYTERLRDYFDFQSGFAYKSAEWIESGVPVVKIMNVKNRLVNLEGCSFISTETAKSTVAFTVSKGDLLFNMTGATLGVFGFYESDSESRMNQRVGKFIPKSENPSNLKYLAYFLESFETQVAVANLAKGAAQPNISPTDILSIPIHMPNPSEQLRISSYLDANLSHVSQTTLITRQIELQANALRRSLLQAAFTGQLTKKEVNV